MPVVRDGFLYVEDEARRILLDSVEWSSWLVSAHTFDYQQGTGSFLVGMSQHRHCDFWYGYKRISGELCKLYIGRPQDMTLQQLAKIALRFSDMAAHPKSDTHTI